jgi:hypothetical protein
MQNEISPHIWFLEADLRPVFRKAFYHVLIALLDIARAALIRLASVFAGGIMRRVPKLASIDADYGRCPVAAGSCLPVR